MFNWFWKLFEKQWEVHPCGCRYYQGIYTPLEVERCEECEKKWQEWLRTRPPEPPREDNDFFIYFS